MVWIIKSTTTSTTKGAAGNMYCILLPLIHTRLLPDPLFLPLLILNKKTYYFYHWLFSSYAFCDCVFVWVAIKIQHLFLLFSFHDFSYFYIFVQFNRNLIMFWRKKKENFIISFSFRCCFTHFFNVSKSLIFFYNIRQSINLTFKTVKNCSLPHSGGSWFENINTALGMEFWHFFFKSHFSQNRKIKLKFRNVGGEIH